MREILEARVSARHLVVVLAFALAVVLTTWGASSGDLWMYVADSVPGGQLLYVLSKACGLTSVVLLWAQIVAGLALATGGTQSSLSIQWHRKLGSAVLVMLLLHWGTFVGAVSIRTGRFAVDYVIPTFSHGFYRLVVSLGIVALLAIAVGAGAALQRQRFQWWRALHVLAGLGAAGGAVHSWLIGSETRMWPVKGLYLFMAITLVCALAWRIARGRMLRAHRNTAGSFLRIPRVSSRPAGTCCGKRRNSRQSCRSIGESG